MTQYPQTMDYYQIRKILPYDPPWLLIDRLLYWDDKKIVVQKVVSGADPMVAAHFPNGPSVIPGVLHIEFVSQAILLLGALHAAPGSEQPPTVLARCKGDFISPGFIGDTLVGEVTIDAIVAGKTMYAGSVHCGERLVCKVTGIAALLDHALNSGTA